MKLPARSLAARLFLPAAAAASALLGGCASNESRDQLAEIRSNPTPELQTLTKRPDDIDNQLTINFNTDIRSLSRDVGVLLGFQGPSRLSPYPIR
ncbi:MAG: hypothetical protein ACKVS8_10160 [Phycisphaerales bacterium]